MQLNIAGSTDGYRRMILSAENQWSGLVDDLRTFDGQSVRFEGGLMW